MNTESGIPSQPLDLRYNHMGFLPHVALHRHGHVYHQESSYSHWWFLGIMLLAAVIIWLSPWQPEMACGHDLKWWITGALVWSGICGVVPYWVRNAFGQTIIIDTQEHVLTIRQRNEHLRMAWADIIGLQICYQENTSDPDLNGYQLILVWKDAQAHLQRSCLLKHSIKKFVVRLGKEYSDRFHFDLITDP